MPTVLLLDNSLSMLCPVAPTTTAEGNTAECYLELAKVGLERVLAHLEAKFKLESVSLMTFSSTYNVLAPFTREVSSVRNKLRIAEAADTSEFIQGLRGLSIYVSENWAGSGSDVRLDVIVVTDGCCLAGGGLSDLESVLPLRCGLASPSSVHVCILNKNAEKIKDAISPDLAKTDAASSETKIHCVTEMTRSGVEESFQALATSVFKPFVGTLTFGSEMKSKVSLCPPPQPYKEVRSFETVEVSATDLIEVKGILSMSDVKSPPVVSRHLVVPEPSQQSDSTDSMTPAQEEALRNQPNLIVFLHNALRSEGLCGLVQVAGGEEKEGRDSNNCAWFGILFSHSDKKSRSCLMLALFEPGETPVPWLGNLRRLGPASELSSRDHFPVKASVCKPSYSSAPVVWIESHALIYDIQKILRQARKLPDKQMSFYKELNRLKRAALCLGFYELLDGVASIFEREGLTMPQTFHPDCSRQLGHVANELRSRAAMSVDYVISPLH